MKVREIMSSPVTTCSEDTPVKDAMSRYIVTVDADCPTEAVAEIFGAKRLRRILITEKGKLVGILTARGLLIKKPKVAVKHFAEGAAEAIEEMKRMSLEETGSDVDI